MRGLPPKGSALGHPGPGIRSITCTWSIARAGRRESGWPGSWSGYAVCDTGSRSGEAWRGRHDPRHYPGMPVPNEATLELEASGHGLVELKNDGDSVSLLNNTGVNANSIVIRASIPDAPTGGGITATLDLYVNGAFRQTITLSSKQSWTYPESSGNQPRRSDSRWQTLQVLQ